jgi:hypothetical protein
MAPRDVTTRSRPSTSTSKTKSVRNHSTITRKIGDVKSSTIPIASSQEQSKFIDSTKKILKQIRELKIRDRVCSQEFEQVPDRETVPMYYDIITDPVALQDLERQIKQGKITNPQQLSARFLVMVKNAKIFNREGSTIFKDANRLFIAFQQAMKDHLNVIVDDEHDPDEEEAWGRDLKERPSLAAYERQQYLESQHEVAQLRAAAARNRIKPQFERDLKHFTDTPLLIQWKDSMAHTLKKQLQRKELVEELAQLQPGYSDRKREANLKQSHDVESCLVCNPSTHEIEEKEEKAALPAVCKLANEVVTPKFTEIVPPGRGKPGTPRARIQSQQTSALMYIDPASRSKLKTTTRKRNAASSESLLDEVCELSSHKLQKMSTGSSTTKQHHLRNRKATSSPDSVSDYLFRKQRS